MTNELQRLDKECDDGNATSGDGCSTACSIEDGFQCNNAGAACSLRWRELLGGGTWAMAMATTTKMTIPQSDT